MIGENDIPNLETDKRKNAVSKDVARDDDNRSIDRKVTPEGYIDSLTRDGAIYWHHDPATLRDYSENTVVKTFIDTVSRDVSKQDWDITINDEESDKDAVRFLRYAHPDKSWQDLIESTVRNTMVLGNAFWVIHSYKNSEEPAEIIDPDPATMFIEKDDDGFISNYIHNPIDGEPKRINAEQVLHFKLKSDTHTDYSDSFISDSTDIIEIIDEIQRKESLNLKKASQSGMLTQTDTHPTDPLTGEQWNQLKDYVTDTNQGKTHQISVGKGEFDFIPFEGKYTDLDLKDRYKQFIQVLGAQFGVNPSYVGFDFENTNRATDESQRQAYKERGVRTILSNIKSKINHKLIPMLTDDDAKFTWQIKQSDEMDEVEYYERLGNAVQALDDAGIDAEINDEDKLNIIGFKSDSEAEQEEAEQKPPEVEECVESFLDENPDMSKEEAYAICNEQVKEDSGNEQKTINMDEQSEKLSDRQQELLEAVPYQSFKETLEWLDGNFSNRTDAITFVQNVMDGTMSQSTYYDWLEEYDLK